MKTNKTLDEVQVERQIKIWIANLQKKYEKYEQISNDLNKIKDYSQEGWLKHRKCILKDSYKNINELYNLIKTERGQDILGDVLFKFRCWDADSWSNYLLLGYKILLLTKDLNITKQVLNKVSGEQLEKEITADIIKIANAERIIFKNKEVDEDLNKE